MDGPTLLLDSERLFLACDFSVVLSCTDTTWHCRVAQMPFENTDWDQLLRLSRLHISGNLAGNIDGIIDDALPPNSRTSWEQSSCLKDNHQVSNQDSIFSNNADYTDHMRG